MRADGELQLAMRSESYEELGDDASSEIDGKQPEARRRGRQRRGRLGWAGGSSGLPQSCRAEKDPRNWGRRGRVETKYLLVVTRLGPGTLQACWEGATATEGLTV